MWKDDWERWQMHDTDGSAWVLMMLLMVVAVAAVIVVVVLLVRPVRTAAAPPPPAMPPSGPSRPDTEALRILRRRFAAGEIDEEEFRSRAAALAEHS